MPEGTATPHIWRDAEGQTWIDQTNIKVIDLLRDHLAFGWNPEETHSQYPRLTLAQIHAALAYYYDHKAELDQRIEVRCPDKIDGRQQNSKSTWWALAPAISGLLFFLILMWFGERLQLSKFSWEQVGALSKTIPSLSAPRPVPDSPAKDLVARILWGISGVVLLTLCLATVVYSTFSLTLGNKKIGPPWRTFWIALALMAACLLLTVTCIKPGLSALSGGQAFHELVQVMDGNQSSAINYLLDPKMVGVHLSHTGQSMTTMDVAAGIALISVAIAASCLLYKMQLVKSLFFRKDKEGPRSDLSLLNAFTQCNTATTILLELTAAGLVVSVFEVYFLSLAASYHFSTEIQASVAYFARKASLANGIVYSAFLAAIFVPLALQQRECSRLILQDLAQSSPEDFKKKASEAAELNLEGARVLKWTLSVLAPLLAAALAELSKSLVE